VAHSLVLDVLGLVGLMLIVVAAVRLARRHKSWGGHLMVFGAACLLVARLYLLGEAHLGSEDFFAVIGPAGIAATIALPPLLLSFGLAGVVWGLWGHDRWLRESGR
jgi:hypothetical protein